MASTSRSGRGGEEHDPFLVLEPPYKKIKSSLTAKQYDVFINHRGPDTKTTLAQQLYDSLRQAGIRAYLDAPETELGDYFPSAIKNAIFSSMLHIAILSPKYAESPWCLAELAVMFQTKARIIPLFYNVHPSDFRYIKNGVSEAFSKHEEKGRYPSHDIQQWKECLQSVSGIKGYEFNGENDDLRKLCDDIVSAVVKEKDKKKIPLQVAKYAVGLDELVKDFYSYCRRNGEMTDKIIGIFGMGGSGKTTLAKHLFNSKHSEFSGSAILFDVRENHVKGALTSPQSKFLNDLFRRNDHSFCSIEEGAAQIKHDLEGSQESRFLIVIDDVDHQKQLDALLPIHKDSLNHSSLVIITTRDERLLINAGVTVRYKMKEMNPEHSRELFCWHAFHRQCCKIGFENLVDSFVKACGGLPLALQVMGGHVFGSGMAYWKSQLDAVKSKLDKDIKDTLKISYDALEEDQKEIFIDIACFFIGEDVSRAISIWKASGWRAEHALQTLKDKCLVQVRTSYDGFEFGSRFEPDFFFEMHDHLRDLGREMADKETDNQMSHPRRLWRPEDLIGMREIKGFQDTLSVSEGKSFRCYSSLVTSFALDIFDIEYFLGSSKTSTNLQWLKLRSYGCNSFIPEWIPLQNLYTLSLVGVSPARLWQRDDQVLIKLKELSCIFNCRHENDMSDANELVHSLGMLKNLESLHIGWNLEEDITWNVEWNCLLKSVRELTNLQTIRLESLIIEGEFALSNRGKTTDDRFRMRSLEAITLCQANGTTKVSISGQVCPTLKSLILSRMEDLIEVDLTGVTTLERLKLLNCPHLRNVLVNDLRRLEIFHIKLCPTMTELPNFGSVSCLTRISISRCLKLEDISAIETLKGLKRIWIAYCPKLKSIKAIEQLKGLKRIWIQGCRHVEGVICLKELKELKRIFIGECSRLQSMEGVEYLRVVESIMIVGCPKLKGISGVEELEGLKEMIISDSPAINCVERLQRLPSELTTLGRSVLPDLELRLGCKRRSLQSYFNADQISDTLSMVDASCEIKWERFDCRIWEKVKEMIHSFHKTHHLLSAFIFCAVVILPLDVESDILYNGTRTVDTGWAQVSVNLNYMCQELVYISVVTEERLSEYVSSMLPYCYSIEKAFIMGVKEGEERKSLRILQSLFAQLCIHNSQYDGFSESESQYEYECEYDDLEYDDLVDCIDKDTDDDNDNASEF